MQWQKSGEDSENERKITMLKYVSEFNETDSQK